MNISRHPINDATQQQFLKDDLQLDTKNFEHAFFSQDINICLGYHKTLPLVQWIQPVTFWLLNLCKHIINLYKYALKDANKAQ